LAVRAPLPLTDAWCQRLSALLAEAPINLVSRRDRSDVRRLHVDESVAIAQHLRIRDGAAWLDLGTGGGLPGLVLAAAFPTVVWTLLDAREKKLVQVAGFAGVLGVDNVTTLHGRAEELADDRAYAGCFDGVIARAVAPLPQTVALARPFVTRGEVVAVRGPRALEEVKDLVPWSDHLGITVDTVSPIGGTIRPTWLVRLRGRGPVPARFPQVRKQLLQNKGNARHYSGAIRPEADMPGMTGETPQGTSEEA
jgi:16S rRNA (guanine527-N7)-methyltransferase